MEEKSWLSVLCLEEEHLRSQNLMLIRLKIVFPGRVADTGARRPRAEMRGVAKPGRGGPPTPGAVAKAACALPAGYVSRSVRSRPRSPGSGDVGRVAGGEAIRLGLEERSLSHGSAGVVAELVSFSLPCK